MILQRASPLNQVLKAIVLQGKVTEVDRLKSSPYVVSERFTSGFDWRIDAASKVIAGKYAVVLEMPEAGVLFGFKKLLGYPTLSTGVIGCSEFAIEPCGC
ncbi:MAG: hypothetical protein WA634_05455 [Silvibacterium sp.]